MLVRVAVAKTAGAWDAEGSLRVAWVEGWDSSAGACEGRRRLFIRAGWSRT